jgi:hypothetical protein
MNAGEFLFVSVMWMAIYRFASTVANLAAEGRSWMNAFASAGKDQVVWLRAL